MREVDWGKFACINYILEKTNLEKKKQKKQSYWFSRLPFEKIHEKKKTNLLVLTKKIL
jgi:hypothetical protein